MNTFTTIAVLFSVIFLIILVIYKRTPTDYEGFKNVFEKLPVKFQEKLIDEIWNSLTDEEQKEIAEKIKSKDRGKD